MTKYFLILIALIGAGLVSCSNDVDVNKIIQKNFEARGGKDFSSVKTIVQEGSAKAPMFSMDFRLLMSIPDKIRYEITAGGNEITTIINGDRGWQIDSVAKPLSAQNREIIKSNMKNQNKTFENELFNYKEKSYSAEFAGEDTVNGKDVYLVKLTTQDSTSIVYYISKDNYLELKSVSEFEANGKKLKQIIIFSDYKDVDGYVIPHKWSYYVRDGQNPDRLMQELTYDKIELNTTLDDKLFARPDNLQLSDATK
jgi:outer membrane lipoprotein-sorting protein